MTIKIKQKKIFKIMNPISLSPNLARILLLSTALIVSIGTAIAGGRSGERNLMDEKISIYKFYKFFTSQIQK
jgi:hypothetical protein